MAVVLYWNARLADRNPLRSESLRIPGYNIRPHLGRPEDNWPRAVAKQAQFLDYKGWFEDEYLPPFAATPYYMDFPDQLPQAANELEFFTTIAPFVYVVGRKQQARSYLVKEPTQHEGEWVQVKKSRNFTRLCAWEDHVAAFALLTGTVIAAPPPMPSKENIDRQASAAQVVIRRIAGNKQRLDEQMRKA